MASFIELITKDGNKELYNTDMIQLVHIHKGEVIVRLSKDNILNVTSIAVKNAYEEIKMALVR